MVRLAMLAGLGVGWSPDALVAADVNRGKLVRVLENWWPPAIPMQLLYPSARHLAPQVRAAIDMLAESLKEALALSR
jgi:DNA-binding transcriptional LysR family regulator